MSLEEIAAGGGVGGDDIGGGSGADGGASADNDPNHVKKMTTTPRPSTAVQLQLRVIRQSLERLMQERVDLSEIKKLLRNSLQSLDQEIETAQQMLKVGLKAAAFQHGQPMPSNFDDNPNLLPIEPLSESSFLEEDFEDSDSEESQVNNSMSVSDGLAQDFLESILDSLVDVNQEATT